MFGTGFRHLFTFLYKKWLKLDALFWFKKNKTLIITLKLLEEKSWKNLLFDWNNEWMKLTHLIFCTRDYYRLAWMVPTSNQLRPVNTITHSQPMLPLKRVAHKPALATASDMGGEEEEKRETEKQRGKKKKRWIIEDVENSRMIPSGEFW